ncbi:AbrB/MazE/SpoVT family DNA-binding domain-containing protein [Streptomonospora arabica]|uniref:AbrB/MazE/SpoVT family DNA-binding domain-containing protein n=1 Tax=Streptomonospora arabica TaxID=412417 RepID=A0ABV9SPQ0_9ACTN
MDEHLGVGDLTSPDSTLTVPPEVRRRLGLGNPHAIVEYVERDGEIVLRPRVSVHPDDAWFWSPEGQAAEQEAEDDLAAGRYTTFEDEEEFLAHLDEVTGRKPGEAT